jgi:hypothetical protein
MTAYFDGEDADVGAPLHFAVRLFERGTLVLCFFGPVVLG